MGLKANAAAHVPHVYPKNHKNKVFWGKGPAVKISRFCYKSFHDDTDSHFVFKFHGNCLPGLGETTCCIADKKSSQNAAFQRHFAPVRQKLPKVYRMHAMRPCLP